MSNRTSNLLPLAPHPSPLIPLPDLRIVIVGHVDHGKSTLVGRLLHDTGALPDGKMAQIQASCDKRGMPFEWSFLMDALQAERDQNVTIDTTQIWFSSSMRRYCLIDAPGHREFLKNMITGAATADAAVLMIDAAEGIKEQSRRHAYLLYLLGIRQVVVVVNKMDLVGYSQATFNTICAEFKTYLAGLGIVPAAVVPVCARNGENLTEKAASMPWYAGGDVLSVLDGFTATPALHAAPLRVVVQDVYRFDARRVIAGRVESGTLNAGDRVVFSPSGLSAVVKQFEQWPEHLPLKLQASAGEAVGFTLQEQVFVERGQVASHEHDMPLLTNRFKARFFWLHDVPLQAGNHYRLKMGTTNLRVEVLEVLQVLDTQTLTHQAHPVVKKHDVAEVVLRVKGMVAVDDPMLLPRTGRFVLQAGEHIAGGGLIVTEGLQDMRAHIHKSVKSENISTVDFEISPQARALTNGHKGGVLWFTGLSGSGKSTLAKELQKELFAKGYQVYVLDGDNVRYGLCSDLGFSPEDRSENIRRVGEVANLFADAGFVVIAAFISPYRMDRERARNISPDAFRSIYIKAGVEVCEQRDTKGLYQKARAGEISDFTGVSAPYEEPESPDLVVDTSQQTIEQSTRLLLDYVQRQFGV